MSLGEEQQFSKIGRPPLAVEDIKERAHQHLALAEQAASVIPGMPIDTAVAPVNSVAVIGAGTMGAGIAISFASAGISVVLIDANSNALNRALSKIRDTISRGVSKGRISQQEAAERIDRIRGESGLAATAAVDLVVEAVFEDMTLKTQIFRDLASLCCPNTILATNTSRLNIDQIASATSRPESIIGLHFFSPAHVMRLVEVVRGRATAPVVLRLAMAAMRQIGKLPVLVGVCDGFVGNRMSAQYAREAEFLLEEGATPEQVDAALRAFGLAMGRFTMVDLAGLDIAWAGRKRLGASRPAHLRYSKISDRLCEMGRFGQKTGAGFYRYAAGSRTPISDPLVHQLIIECANESGIARRTISDQEVVDRCIFALVNEGAKILQEGIAERPSDIDLIYVNGYGFPPELGGPMFYADALGIDHVYRRICEFESRHGEWWKPAALLKHLAEQGRSFASLASTT